MTVFITESGDTAEMTFRLDSDDYKFDVWHEGAEARAEYQETQGWRGQVLVSDPHETVWRAFFRSDEMTEYLDRHNLRGIERQTKG
jgi:hypothetical protein